MNRLAVVAALVLAAITGQAQDEDWISDDGRVVTLLLAHRDVGRVDGGTLRIDRERHLVTWEGAPNEIGCKKPWEASFDDVVDVKADEPGFLVTLRKDRQELRLIPLPHFAALVGQGRSVGVSPAVKESLKGPDGDFTPLSGSGSSTTPTLARPPLPPAVQRDSARAAEAILRALGRTPR